MGDSNLRYLIVFGALVTAVGPAPAAEQLGRLFFTPAQRSSLDVARTQRARATLSTEKTEQDATPAAQTITYDGMVRRSDGRSTVWLNSRPVNDREPAGGAAIVGRVRPDGGVILQVPQSGRRVELKPGQSVELLTGAVEEGYSRRPPTQPEPKPAVKAEPAAKSAKPSPAEQRAAAERQREERERIEDAVSRALQENAAARPGAPAPSSAPPAEPAR